MGIGGRVYSMLKNTPEKPTVSLSAMPETLVCLSRFLSRSNQVLCTESLWSDSVYGDIYNTLAFVLNLFLV